MSSLEELRANDNALDGSIPSELGNISTLEVLGLYTNELSGSIPANLGSLSSLRVLSLHENQLTGSIPSELGDLSALTHLRLHQNQLTGGIPGNLSNLSSLVSIYVQANDLSGVVPLSVAQMGGQIQADHGISECNFAGSGNAGLSLVNDQDYRDADQDNDGAICIVGGLTLDLEVTTASLADGVVGTGYNASLAATGGDQPYTWTLSVGDLPDGLTLNTDGTITGTPTTQETASFTVQVASSTDGQTATADLSITIYEVLTVTTASLSGGENGTPYTGGPLAASGGDGSYTWTLASGSDPLPTGLTLNTDGTITGTPTVTATFSFTVQVDSGDEQTATKLLSIEVTDPPNPD
jgi:hypothetical protein